MEKVVQCSQSATWLLSGQWRNGAISPFLGLSVCLCFWQIWYLASAVARLVLVGGSLCCWSMYNSCLCHSSYILHGSLGQGNDRKCRGGDWLSTECVICLLDDWITPQLKSPFDVHLHGTQVTSITHLETTVSILLLQSSLLAVFQSWPFLTI